MWMKSVTHKTEKKNWRKFSKLASNQKRKLCQSNLHFDLTEAQLEHSHYVAIVFACHFALFHFSTDIGRNGLNFSLDTFFTCEVYVDYYDKHTIWSLIHAANSSKCISADGLKNGLGHLLSFSTQYLANATQYIHFPCEMPKLLAVNVSFIRDGYVDVWEYNNAKQLTRLTHSRTVCASTLLFDGARSRRTTTLIACIETWIVLCEQVTIFQFFSFCNTIHRKHKMIGASRVYDH